jgi:phthiocerol/phenolphthiocerol synthesis type-I polyketide synthase C
VLPFYSTVSGKRLSGRPARCRILVAQHSPAGSLRAGDQRHPRHGIKLFIEIGPNPVLRSYLNDCLKERAVEGRVLATAIRPADSTATHLGCRQPGDDRRWTRRLAAFLSRNRSLRAATQLPLAARTPLASGDAASAGLIYRRKLHPLLGYPLPQHELTWENQLDTQLYPVLADHVVGEATSSPGRLSPNRAGRPLPGVAS